MTAQASSAYIVIVEDSILVADAWRILFAEYGYRVALAPSVAAAVDACMVERVDVLLLDLTLPDGDGLEVLSRLDERGSPRPLRTIALTGHGDDENARKCLDAGCERVLLKPVSMRALLGLVQRDETKNALGAG